MDASRLREADSFECKDIRGVRVPLLFTLRCGILVFGATFVSVVLYFPAGLIDLPRRARRAIRK